MRRIIAILIAVALLLTSCGIIFRNEIREIFKEFFVSLTYENDGTSEDMIEEILVLTYVPEGYKLEKESITTVQVRYAYENEDGEILFFEQRALTRSGFVVDSESGYSKIEEIKKHEVYYRFTDKYYHYIWHSGKYSLTIKSSTYLSNEEIILLIDGITIK